MNPIYQSARIDYDKAWGAAGILCPIATIQHVKEYFKKTYPDTNSASAVHSLKENVVRPATAWQHLARAVILSVPTLGSACLLIYDHYAKLDRWKRSNIEEWVDKGGIPENKTNRMEAAKKIWDAYQSESTRLDLRSLQLTSLPEEIGLLTDLIGLYVLDNELVSLPESISQLTNLKYLDLSKNCFTSFPEGILSLSQLKRLNIAFNSLNAFPQEISRLAKLTNLFVEGNKFSSFPTEILSLSTLRSLGLGSNMLEKLPPTINQLTNLQVLGLSSNRLTALPSQLGDLIQLKYINLNNNQLRILPVQIGRLTSLYMLDLENNPELTEIPLSLGEIPTLTYLYPPSNNPVIRDRCESILAICKSEREDHAAIFRVYTRVYSPTVVRENQENFE